LLTTSPTISAIACAMNDRVSWADELRASSPDILDVAALLGLDVTRRRFGPCPACGQADRHHQPVTPRHAGKGWLCASCKAHGDAIRLACWVVLGKDRATTGEEWGRVRAVLASGGWCSADGQTAAAWTPPAPRPPQPETAYPDLVELRLLLGACARVVDRIEVAEWCMGRGFSTATIPAAVLPSHHPWPAWWPYRGSPWRLVCSMVDARGVIRSMHGRATEATERGKTRWPFETRATGLLFADPWIARPMLRGIDVQVERVVVVEGITDYLALSCRQPSGTAVIGACSGGFGALAVARLPGVPVYIATDGDAAGQRYAAEVERALPGADLRRVVLPAGMDVADVLKSGRGVESLWSPAK